MSNGWSEPLIEMSVPLDLGIQGGWSNPLIEISATLTQGIAGGWSNPLAEMTVAITPSEVIIGGWKRVASLMATLSPPTMECSVDSDCPEGYVCVNGRCIKKEAGVPWVLPAAGVAVAAGIIIYAGSKKKGEETKK